MNIEPTSFSYRCNGGSLRADDPTYIRRPADLEFYNFLKAGELCYVLNSRQMGKSSLLNQTMHRLRQEDICCISIDLSAIVEKRTAGEQLYADLIRELISGFQLKINRKALREWYSELSPRQRFIVFIEEILLTRIQQQMVIFFDEIDSLLRLNHLGEIDDFLRTIRSFHDRHAGKSAYRHLSFALLGVASPYDLIQDKAETAFNIGRTIEIELTGFKFEEALPLAQGLREVASDERAVLKEILYWTGGQPFLTQKLCGLVANSEKPIAPGDEARRVKQITQERIIDDWDRKDEPVHLRTIRDRLLNKSSENGSDEQRLKLYHKVLRRAKIFNKTLPIYKELWLSGIVAKDDDTLRVYNRIYQEVFNSEWVRQKLRQLQPNRPSISALTVLATSILVTAAIMGARSLGRLQRWELSAFDHLMRQMPQEAPDRRLLVVGADEKDIQKYGHPLPDAILAQLFDKLQQHQPAAIGLDIVRDRPIPPTDNSGYPALVKHLQRDKNLTTVCYFSIEKPNQAIAPPPSSPEESIGFTDLYRDEDSIIRRYLLSRSRDSGTSSPCQTPYSFSWQLAYLYFEHKDISVRFEEGNWQFYHLLTQRLQPRAGGYQNIDSRGNQLLLNYRKTFDSEQVARQVSVRDILEGNFKPAWVKDRVIFIGMVASSDRDVHDTPHGKISGVYIHAHAVSQILSAVEDNRHLIWYLPWWGDLGVILFWSIAGSVAIFYRRTLFSRGLILSSSLLILYGFCWLGLTQGLWLPFIPSVVVLFFSAGSVTAYIKVKVQNDR
ncbi:MAG: CHASE2 domain-containing protein [Cyanobacteriota bacterium]|nr:CHASE2 domain-containing protein [Cyanobacteriota bacterium]